MNLMGLDEILNELKLLKELMLQVRFLMKLERVCTQKLLQRMQCVINVYYDHSGTLPVTNLPVPPVPLKANSAVVPTGTIQLFPWLWIRKMKWILSVESEHSLWIVYRKHVHIQWESEENSNGHGYRDVVQIRVKRVHIESTGPNQDPTQILK